MSYRAKTIKLPVYGMTIELRFPIGHDEKKTAHGTITSDLHEGKDAAREDMVSAVESLVLAHACAGIDVESPAYLEGIESAINAIWVVCQTNRG